MPTGAGSESSTRRPTRSTTPTRMLTIQATGNSNSIRAWWKPLREAGAGARACFVQAAARGWGVAPAECRTEGGNVIHERTGRKIAYGNLVCRAAAIEPPKDPPLKDPEDSA